MARELLLPVFLLVSSLALAQEFQPTSGSRIPANVTYQITLANSPLNHLLSPVINGYTGLLLLQSCLLERGHTALTYSSLTSPFSDAIEFCRFSRLSISSGSSLSASLSGERSLFCGGEFLFSGIAEAAILTCCLYGELVIWVLGMQIAGSSV
jgi:hypothetical protein